jgi:hypothetical protein
MFGEPRRDYSQNPLRFRSGPRCEPLLPFRLEDHTLTDLAVHHNAQWFREL